MRQQKLLNQIFLFFIFDHYLIYLKISANIIAMDVKYKINSYLNHFGKILNMDLILNESGVCAIKIEEDLPFIIEVPENSKLFYLYAPLKSISGDTTQILDLFGKSLMLNMFQVETNGGALAFSERLQEILYCLTVPIEDCDAERFARIVTDFIINTKKLKQKLMEQAIGSDIE